jgi:hypothetical protein
LNLLNATIPATTENGSASIFGSELFALTLSGIVAAILTIIITFAIQTYLDQPKIKSHIFQLIGGELRWNGNVKSFWGVYIYLTNQHQSPIHVLDYMLWLDFGDGYVRMDRIYGIPVTPGFPDSLSASYPDGRTAIITDLRRKLIYTQNRPVKFGDFVHGFVLFGGDVSLYHKEVKRLKVTCVDVLGKEHTRETTPHEFLKYPLFEEIAGIKVERT